MKKKSAKILFNTAIILVVVFVMTLMPTGVGSYPGKVILVKELLRNKDFLACYVMNLCFATVIYVLGGSL